MYISLNPIFSGEEIFLPGGVLLESFMFKQKKIQNFKNKLLTKINIIKGGGNIKMVCILKNKS